MWPFKSAATVPEPAPVSEPVLGRDEQLVRQLRTVQAELREFDAEALRFKSRYELLFDGLGRITRMKCDGPSMSMAKYACVRADWQRLQNKIAPRLRLFHETLSEIASRKQIREKKLEVV